MVTSSSPIRAGSDAPLLKALGELGRQGPLSEALSELRQHAAERGTAHLHVKGEVGDAQRAVIAKAAGEHASAVLEALSRMEQDGHGRLNLNDAAFHAMPPKTLNKLLRQKEFWQLAKAMAVRSGAGGLIDVTLPSGRLSDAAIKTAISQLKGGPTRFLHVGLLAGRWNLTGLQHLQMLTYTCVRGETLALTGPKQANYCDRGEYNPDVLVNGQQVAVPDRSIALPVAPTRTTVAGSPSRARATTAVPVTARPEERARSKRPGPSHLAECEKRLVDTASRHFDFFRVFRAERPAVAALEADFDVGRLCDAYLKHPSRQLLHKICDERHKAVVSSQLRALLLKGGPEASAAIGRLNIRCQPGRMQFADMLQEFEREVGRQQAALRAHKPAPQPKPKPKAKPASLATSKGEPRAKATPVSDVDRVRAALVRRDKALGAKLDLLVQCHAFLDADEDSGITIRLPSYYQRIAAHGDDANERIGLVRTALVLELMALIGEVDGLGTLLDRLNGIEGA